MPDLCRHNVSGQCAECNTQDTYWSGGKDPTVKRRSEVLVGGRVYFFNEGDPDKARTGMTIRPAAVLLAKYMQGRKWEGLDVLELGAGLGLPGMFAAGNGARVTFAENDKLSCVELQENVIDNGLQARYWSDCWNKLPGGFDSIIGSEILFNVSLIRQAFDTIREKWTGRGPILFTDPNRARGMIEREAPLRGVRLERIPISGEHPDGRRFVCDLWKCEPTTPPRPTATSSTPTR